MLCLLDHALLRLQDNEGVTQMIATQSVHAASSLHKFRLFFLVLFWCLSFMIGILFPKMFLDTTVSLIQMLPLRRESVLGQLILVLFPLCITAAAVYFSVPSLIYFMVILKGIAFGYCLCGSVLVFASAGWLVFGLLAFSDIFINVILFWLWVLYFTDNTGLLKKGYVIYFFSALTLRLIDYLLICPFLISIMY